MNGAGPDAVPAIEIVDAVRDVMVLTLPGLIEDENEASIEPEETIPDDGRARDYVKAFEYDSIEKMAVTDEVYDLMCLAVPELSGWYAEVLVPTDDAPVYEDTLEQAWFDEESLLASMVFGTDILMLSAPRVCALISAAGEEAAAEECKAEREVMPTLSFAFGPQNIEAGWSVTLSF